MARPIKMTVRPEMKQPRITITPDEIRVKITEASHAQACIRIARVLDERHADEPITLRGRLNINPSGQRISIQLWTRRRKKKVGGHSFTIDGRPIVKGIPQP